MTSYTQNDYYLNEIDALSCNNRPISSTLRSKSTFNTYESQTDDDLYGNKEYNDGSSCDSYIHHQRSTSDMSNTGNYNVSYYNNDYNQLCYKNVINTDNLMYHRDACSGDSSNRYDIYTALDYSGYDNRSSDYGNYGSLSDGNTERPYTAFGDSSYNKILPQISSVQHSYSMWDGMYSSVKARHSDVSLPSTPTFRYSGGGASGSEMRSGNDDWGKGLITNGVKAQLNGHRHHERGAEGAAFYRHHKPPERVLPLPQSQPQTFVRKSLKQQFFEDKTGNATTNESSTTSMSPYTNLGYKMAVPVSSTNQKYPHSTPTKNVYDNDGGTTESQLMNTSETEYNNSYYIYDTTYEIEPRPHTAMQTTEHYGDFGFNSMDNISIYSDKAAPSTYAANQQKMQDLQKCRYSIIMAMTTASVIASGETRIPQHLLKKTTKTISSDSDPATTTLGVTKTANTGGIDGIAVGRTPSSLSYRYDDNSSSIGFVDFSSNKKNNISGNNSLTSCAYTTNNIIMKSNQSSIVLPPLTLTTAASSSMLLLSSASPIVANSADSTKDSGNERSTLTEVSGSYTGSMGGVTLLKNLSSRKLPKHHYTAGRLGLVTNKPLPQSINNSLSHTVNASNKLLPEILQTSKQKAADDKLSSSSILTSTSTVTSAPQPSTALTASSLESTSSPSTSSPLALSYQSNLISSLSFLTTTAKSVESTLSTTTATTTLESDIGFSDGLKSTSSFLPTNNNNNGCSDSSNITDFKIYDDNFNKFKTNYTNFSNNNVQNTVQSDTSYYNEEVKKENQDKSISHLSATTPSKLISSTHVTTDDTLSSLPTSVAISESNTKFMYDSDYKTSSYDIADYLKPYTLPTFTTNNSSGSTSYNSNIQYTLTHSYNSSNSSSCLPYPSSDLHNDYLTLVYTSPSSSLPLSTTSTKTNADITTSKTATTTTIDKPLVDTSKASLLSISSLTSSTLPPIISSTVATSAATLTSTTILPSLAINNNNNNNHNNSRGLNNTTALNLSDNKFSHNKSSISSPVICIGTSPSGSVVLNTSTSCYAMTTATATATKLSSSSLPSSSFLDKDISATTPTEATATTTTNNIEQNLNDSVHHDYNHYFENYKLDVMKTTTKTTTTFEEPSSVIMQSSTTTDTPITAITTLTTIALSDTSSSLTLNKSSPKNTTSSYATLFENNNSCTNNNETENVALFSYNCLLTTTSSTVYVESKFTATSTFPTTTTPVTTITDMTTITHSSDYLTAIVDSGATSTTTLPFLYSDYLKDYTTTTVTAGTALSSNTFFATNIEITENSSQELPAYITDFLNSSKANDYSSDYLDLYKLTDDKTMRTETDIKCSEIGITDATITTTLYDVTAETTPTVTATAITTTITKTSTTTSSTTIQETLTSLSNLMSTSITTTTSHDSLTKLYQPSLTESQPAANTFLTMTVDFDDNFYNSFSVNLNSLIEDSSTSTSTIPATSCDNSKESNKSEVNTSIISSVLPTTTAPISIDSFTLATSSPTTKEALNADITSTSNDLGHAYIPSTTTAATPLPSITTASTTPQKTYPGVKSATSMLGGLSQSIKGGLDGVLAASGSSVPTTTQQQKRGFGFGLASKFVPQVGGLLGTAIKSTTPSTTAATHITPLTSSNSMPSTTLINEHQSAVTCINDITKTSTTKDQIAREYQTSGYYDSSQSNGGDVYYNSSQPTYYHMTSSLEYVQDEMANSSEQQIIMYDDSAITAKMNGLNKDYYADDEHLAHDEYDGYSEYESKTQFITTTHAAIATTAVVTTAPKVQESLAPNDTFTSSSTTVTAAKKATSSLFSSLTNAASQISQQTPLATATTSTAASTATTSSNASTTSSGKTGMTGGGGMFGSIFGKAAAAMQTATQVVNQGASMATTKVQKNLQTTANVATLNKKLIPSTTVANNATSMAVDQQSSLAATSESNFQRGVMQHQDSLVSPYTSSHGGGSGDDYDNSNIPIIDREFDQEEYYYVNQNHQLVRQQSQQKLLPAVPPAGGSTGKKLPTINDKSGCLGKQQPTEIYEEDTEVLGNKSLPCLKRAPTYDIDSEQDDYYMDAQPVVAPSERHMIVNGYYEHTNGSYNYRDDYFNEEDEFKYLEKEKNQAAEEVMYISNQQSHYHHLQQLRQIYKQSSLQYIVEDDYPHEQNEIIDEYIDDMYHSEDSGNYLDESSSGSVEGLAIKQEPDKASSTTASESVEKKITTSTTTASSTKPTTSATAHQQIKKQDNIIQEEDEKEEISSIVGMPEEVGIASPSKSSSRKSSHDIFNIEDDQIGELQMVSLNMRSSQSRKIKLMRGETEEVVGGHMQIMKRKTEVTAKQRWHWAYNKIIMQLNVSTLSNNFNILIYIH